MEKEAFSFQVSGFRKRSHARRVLLKAPMVPSGLAAGFTPYHFSSKSDKGFTLLLSALVASIVLALGTSLFTIASKELTLSALGRDSQFAFYTADTAAECALYWDFRFQYFGPEGAGLQPTCDGQPLHDPGNPNAPPSGRPPAPPPPYAYPYTITFEYAPGGLCADVTVHRFLRDPSEPSHVSTTIHADGYSTDCISIATSPRVLQRSVELNY